MQSNPQPEQITKTVVGVTTVFIGGIALLSSVFVVRCPDASIIGRHNNDEEESEIERLKPAVEYEGACED